MFLKDIKRSARGEITIRAKMRVMGSRGSARERMESLLSRRRVCRGSARRSADLAFASALEDEGGA